MGQLAQPLDNPKGKMGHNCPAGYDDPSARTILSTFQRCYFPFPFATFVPTDFAFPYDCGFQQTVLSLTATRKQPETGFACVCLLLAFVWASVTCICCRVKFQVRPQDMPAAVAQIAGALGKSKHRRCVELCIQMCLDVQLIYVYTILYRFDMVWHNPPWW